MKRSKKNRISLRESLLRRVRGTPGWLTAFFSVVVLAGLLTFRIDLSADSVLEWLSGGRIVGNTITIIMLVGLWMGYLHLREPELMTKSRMRYFLLAIVIFVAVIGKSFDLLAPYLVRPDQAAFLIPVAMGAGLATIFAGAEIGISLVILLSFWVGLGDTINAVAILAAFGSGAAAVFRCARLRRLSDLPLAGLEIGLFGMLLHGGAGLVVYGFEFNPLMMIWSGLNGVMSVLLLFGAMPLAEIITQRTSPLGLVELLNPTSPLLLLLREQAPGTYHHSITVADLAESAARAVGADPLLTKVGGYYHDIGKMKRPQFFVENQRDGSNPHDEISPSMSKMILTSHIKEGVELAREYGLREDIIAFISQHHGTSVIRYFYQKAVREGKATEGSMGDFRYDAELPQTKETAIVMLSDVVGAASQSLEDLSQLEDLIHRAMQTPIGDDQLSESPLTLRDIGKIERAFFDTIRAMRHDRGSSYPTESKETSQKQNNKS